MRDQARGIPTSRVANPRFFFQLPVTGNKSRFSPFLSQTVGGNVQRYLLTHVTDTSCHSQQTFNIHVYAVFALPFSKYSMRWLALLWAWIAKPKSVTVNNSASQQIMHTMQRLKFLLVLLIAFIFIVIAATFSYFGSSRLNITSSLIKGVQTDVEERHYYNIHSWQGESLFKNTHSTFMPLSVVFPANAFVMKSFYVHFKAETGLKKEVGAL